MAENWPGWRGPRGDGTSQETGVPVKWSVDKNVAWKTPIRGLGHSSPIVWGDRIFLTTAIAETKDRLLLSLDRKTGKILWQKTVVNAPLETKNKENSYASATPVTDGQGVYVTFLDSGHVLVAAYDFDGRQQWAVRPGKFESGWGFCHSPVLVGDKLLVACHGVKSGFIAALNRVDGKTLWYVEAEGSTHSFSVPLVQELAGRTQIILPGRNALTSYDPKDGNRLWFADGPSQESIATPVYNAKVGLVLCASSWPARFLMAVKPDGRGNVTADKVAWKTKEGAPYVPSPIAVDDYFFSSSFAGKRGLVCLEAASGKVLWQQERAGLHHASPVAANGLVYFLNDDGVMHVLKAGPQLELVARNDLGEPTYASPAISQGQMFLRSFSHLYCIVPAK
jgi:outer membrane protein assembly factor BamB